MRVHDTVQTAQGQYDFGRVATQSPAMREVLEMTRRASESEPTTILIRGESGTGKEVLAKAIHYNSQRAQMPVISPNCAALSDTLLDFVTCSTPPDRRLMPRAFLASILLRSCGA